ncbi:LLM class flavin-dependent oxidoreductase [Nonomuraea sediminis]|uniref:LLM class flavin-dependent oxidoreductase n=1 Tax=Nonomuraea sediminis TaxID=2835864 RepID=UPI001BDD3786|nr:LLM class flavin-dependent oxidoreductase [Nonomuraea sediminis]
MPRFGIQLAPTAAQVSSIRELARMADREGLDLLGVQDHPYAAEHVDAFALMATVLTETERLRVFPDVANLPLRGPAMLGKAAAGLDLLSGGRFELGLGSGGFWPAIASMGGPTRTSGEALQAMVEGIEIIRAMWRPGERVRVEGEHYTVKGVHGGPAPLHRVGIWVGSVGPRAHAVTGRLADGWAAPIPHYLPYEKWRASQDIIDKAAGDAGRDPASITRMAQLVGDITEAPAPVRLEGENPIRTSAREWAKILASLATETGFDTFVYWPENPDATQLLRWAREVVPATRALLG